MVILMATLFWVLWDEAYGQRPWKAFQHEWKQRYGTFLKTAESKSAQSEKDAEQSTEYQQLEQAYQQAYQAAKPRRDELQEQIIDLNAKTTKRKPGLSNIPTVRRRNTTSLNWEKNTASLKTNAPN